MWSMQLGRLPTPYAGLIVQISIEIVIIPMFVLTRLEAALLPTKDEVVALYQSNPNTPEKVLENKSGYKYYNTSPFTLENLQNDPNAIEENFSCQSRWLLLVV
ncbi:MAG: type I restriction-modification system subunit M N-terminal domain-containing protein [Streptococcus sp.]